MGRSRVKYRSRYISFVDGEGQEVKLTPTDVLGTSNSTITVPSAGTDGELGLAGEGGGGTVTEENITITPGTGIDYPADTGGGNVKIKGPENGNSPKTQTLQDKNGTVALLEDYYVAESTLSADYTVTSNGGKVLEITLPSDGYYMIEVCLGGVVYFGPLDDFNGVLKAYAVADIVGEGDQTNFKANLRTASAVTGVGVFERGHSSIVYETGNDFFFRNVKHINNSYIGSVLGSFQSGAFYFEAGGKFELYLNDNNAGSPNNGTGYHKVLAGSKIGARKIASFTYPPIMT